MTTINNKVGVGKESHFLHTTSTTKRKGLRLLRVSGWKKMADGEISSNKATEFEDLLPTMAEKLKADDFVSELCGGFQLLADPARGLITSESLRRNSALLGMEGMTKEESEAMVREGDLDGDGGLNQMEFCILMVRLSPGMMEDAEAWLEKALQREIK